MDLFFECAPVAAKRRVHFNKFMLDGTQGRCFSSRPLSFSLSRLPSVARLGDYALAWLRLLERRL